MADPPPAPPAVGPPGGEAQALDHGWIRVKIPNSFTMKGDAPELPPWPPAPRPSSPWQTIWKRPRPTIRTIVATDPGRHVLAIMAGTGLARALVWASSRDLGDRLSLGAILGLCATLGPIASIVMLYVGAAIFRRVAGWFGGRASSAEVRAAIAWGSVPYLAILALWVPSLLLGGHDLFTSAGPKLDAPEDRIDLLSIKFANLLLLVWSLRLTVVCLSEVLKIPSWRVLVASVPAALILVVIVVVPLAVVTTLASGPPGARIRPVQIQLAPAERAARGGEVEVEDTPLSRSSRPPAEAGPAILALWSEHCRVSYRADTSRPGRPIVRLVLGQEADEPFPAEALRHLEGLPDLEELEIAAGLTNADLAPLRSLKRLRKLDLLAARITDAGLENLAGLAELEEVQLIACGRIRGPGLKHLRAARGLRKLNLSSCRVGGANLAQVRALGSLKELDLGGQEAGVLNDASLVHLEDWTGLETLSLGATNPIRGPGLAHLAGLRDLRSLDLVNSPVTDDGVEPLAKLTGLRRLNLSDTRITPAGLDRLRQALPDTRIDPP